MRNHVQCSICQDRYKNLYVTNLLSLQICIYSVDQMCSLLEFCDMSQIRCPITALLTFRISEKTILLMPPGMSVPFFFLTVLPFYLFPTEAKNKINHNEDTKGHLCSHLSSPRPIIYSPTWLWKGWFHGKPCLIYLTAVHCVPSSCNWPNNLLARPFPGSKPAESCGKPSYLAHNFTLVVRHGDNQEKLIYK